jgi:hypothetical protein
MNGEGGNMAETAFEEAVGDVLRDDFDLSWKGTLAGLAEQGRPGGRHGRKRDIVIGWQLHVSVAGPLTTRMWREKR